MSWFKNVKEKPRELIESVVTILIAVIVALVFRSVVAAPYKIPTGSMIPTLKVGDFIFVSKLSYGLKIPFTNKNLIDFSEPSRGDVIVFIYPEDPSLDFIKRIVGVPGDKIEMKESILYINDKALERDLIRDHEILSDVYPSRLKEVARLYREKLGDKEHLAMEFLPFSSDFGPVTVPKGHLFMMGDNRDNSKDSRVWGFLPMKDVRGRALFIWLSIDTEDPIFSFIPRIRWGRFGQKVI